MGFKHFTAIVMALKALNVESTAADCITYDWRITSIYSEYDGVYIPSLGINDRPADKAIIEVTLGQEVEVHVTNQIHEPTCLHWHGLKQLGTQEMDGTSEITQCHIPPNGTITYRFMPDKAGTFWWHSHHLAQYAFGLRGPLIVHAPVNQKQDWEARIDGEHVVQMADLYHRPPQTTRMWDNILINNRGRYNCYAALQHNFTNCTNNQSLSNFFFQPGYTYRLRLINMAALSPIVFSIDDHEFSVVAADGDYLQPSKLINSLMLNAGQRYDIIVKAKIPTNQKAVNSFYMRAIGLHGLPWTRGRGADAGVGFTTEGLGVITYEFRSNVVPTSQKQQFLTTINEFDYMPLLPVVLPKFASDRSVMQFKMEKGLGYMAIDGGDFHHFQHPPEAPLFSIASGMKTEELPIEANARKIKYGDHIEVVLVNARNEQHPFHMHTHSPWVVRSGVASLKQIQDNQLPPLQLENPMTRDVYTVPPCTSDGKDGCLNVGYVVLRFTADNPGVWIFHCHIDWHVEAGLSMILVEGEKELQELGVTSFSNTILSVCGSTSKFSMSNASCK
ncbi:hypothetical protein CCR75_002540 [Bremia lactucae]|uniref:Laccase n=1 Tax=Bremia lactucae TaxID=4779 RepID=A0A976IEW9_BRELC|nr:hypothetical protein CCR75_002540 [Bremia lactucae]